MTHYRARLLTCLILISTLQLFGQESDWQLPPSPTGKLGTALLEILDGATDEELDVFIQQKLSADFIAEHSAARVKEMLRNLQNELGKFELNEIRKTGQGSVQMGLSGESGDSFQMTYHISAQEPFFITGLEFDADGGGGGGGDVTFANLKELDAHLRDQTAASKFSGVGLIARKNEILFHQAYGMASKLYDVPNQLDTKFNIGSINKEITAVAIMQLMEKGKLTLDDTIDKFLPMFPAAVAGKITIRHLLQHKSGWSHYWDNEYFLANARNIESVDDLMVFIKDIPLEFEPGTRQQYSNIGYEVLGAIVQKASGQDYYEYIREHIYRPAGMENSDSYAKDIPIKNLAMGYTKHSEDGTQDGPERENIFPHSRRGTPAGGGYSTAEDLLRFDRALREHKLLSERSTNILFHQFQDQHAEKTPRGGIGLAGGAPGINATWELDFPADLTVIVMSNYDPPSAEELGAPIMRLALTLE